MTLNELKAVCDAATPGPWGKLCSSVTNWPHGAECPDVLMEWIPNGGEYALDRKQAHTDSALMATSRTALPALIEFVQAVDGLIIAAMNGALDGPEDVEVEMAAEAREKLMSKLGAL